MEQNSEEKAAPSAWWLAFDESEATVACQHVWGARPGHRDELILRDRNTELSSASSSSSEGFDERLWSLMDYYDPTSAVNTEGEVVERYRFSAFGMRTVLAPDFSPRVVSHYEWDFAFKGQFLDVDTGYYNYGYRYYSPELGRWLSRDPAGEKGGLNTFLFLSNSPENYHDALGLVAVGMLNSLITDDHGGRGGETSVYIVRKDLNVVQKGTGGCEIQFVAIHWRIRAKIGARELYTGPDFINGFNLKDYHKFKNASPVQKYFNTEGLSYEGVRVHEQTHINQLNSIANLISDAISEHYKAITSCSCDQAWARKQILESEGEHQFDTARWYPLFKAAFHAQAGFAENRAGEYEAVIEEWKYYDSII